MKRDIGLSVGGEVDFRIGAPWIAGIRWNRLPRGVFVGGVGWGKRSVRPGGIGRQRRQSGRIGCDRARIGVSVISVSRMVSVTMRMGRISSMVRLRAEVNQVIGRVLRQLV